MADPFPDSATIQTVPKGLRFLTFAVALLLALGEMARWWGSARMVPLALDEWLVAAALAGAAWIAPRRGVGPLAAAWGLFTGLMLGLSAVRAREGERGLLRDRADGAAGDRPVGDGTVDRAHSLTVAVTLKGPLLGVLL
jgi:hypothetical protein